MKKFLSMGVAVGLLLGVSVALAEEAAPAGGGEMNITKEIASIDVKHGNQTVTIKRNPDANAVIDPEFAKTGRKCPPFCAQPIHAAPGVETYGEVEVVHFMQNEMAQGTGVLVDARTPDWHAKGTIPGSINVPYNELSPSLGAEDVAIQDAMTRFGVTGAVGAFDFSKAKTLVIWCNGPWCGQSPTAIKGLLELGYPVDKIKYYRGGMQVWHVFGLTTVPPAAQ